MLVRQRRRMLHGCFSALDAIGECRRVVISLFISATLFRIVMIRKGYIHRSGLFYLREVRGAPFFSSMALSRRFTSSSVASDNSALSSATVAALSPDSAADFRASSNCLRSVAVSFTWPCRVDLLI